MSNPLSDLLGKTSKPLQDEKQSPSAKSNIEKSPDQEAGISNRGLNNERSPEPVPKYEPAAAEKVLSSNTNAAIVLGKDRPSNIASGYGGSGATGAGAIDIVAGRKPLDPTQYIDPNFITDAARIQVSGLTDVDKNFDLAKGNVGPAIGRSAIGLKADGIRVVAREGIKLVTEGRGSTNSQGGKIRSTVGIDLIAGNDTDDFGRKPFLQPIPKGFELAAALGEMMDLMDDLAAMVDAIASNQIRMNKALSTHIHMTPFGPTDLSWPVFAAAASTITMLTVRVTAPMKLHRQSTTTFRADALTPGGPSWICSRHNNAN